MSRVPPAATVAALRRSAYSLPVTPQMLLLAAQRLRKGAGADVKDFVCYISKRFPLMVRGRSALEAEVRRKLALCVNAGVLEQSPLCCKALWGGCVSDACLYKPACDLAVGRADRARVRRFWDEARVCCCYDDDGGGGAGVSGGEGRDAAEGDAKRGHSCERRCGKIGRRQSGRLHPRWMRRALCSVHSALQRLVEQLAPEDEQGTQTDSRVTDWVDPEVADADYVM